MRAKSFHGASNCERPQETSQDTYSIKYKCVLNLSMVLLIAKDLKKHRKTRIQLGINALNLSMRLPIVKDVDKHRRIHIKVIK